MCALLCSVVKNIVYTGLHQLGKLFGLLESLIDNCIK